jgi:FkbM family methyltransferase
MKVRMLEVAKAVLPRQVRERLTEAIDPLDNRFFGLIFSLLHTKYKTEGLIFDYPKKVVHLGYRSRFLWDLYERAERFLVKKYVNSEDSVLEVGACLGVVSCVTNRKIGNSSRHVVIEANPYLIPWLVSNKLRNKCNFVIEWCSVGTSVKSNFLLGRSITTGSCDETTRGDVDVVTRSLSELHAKHGAFDVLIMDIEGGEWSFLMDFHGELGRYRLLIIEFHDKLLGERKTNECKQVLEDSGFVLVESLVGNDVYMRRGAKKHCIAT